MRIFDKSESEKNLIFNGRSSFGELDFECESLCRELHTRSIVLPARFELASKAREALILDRARRQEQVSQAIGFLFIKLKVLKVVLEKSNVY